MSLDLNKLRGASHDNISVGGSYTDTMIEAQGIGDAAKFPAAFVKWVPNNKSGSGYYSGNGVNIDSSNFEESGYLNFDAYAWNNANGGGNGYHVLTFSYFNDTNAYNGGSTSPGIRLVRHNFYGSNEEELSIGAEYLTNTYDSSDKVVMVIINTGSIYANTAWATAFRKFRSWRMGTNVTQSETNWSYAGVVTNVNNIGQLSEALQGTGLLATNANVGLVIEHDATTIGHAGYGEDLSSGTGAGAFSYTEGGSSVNTIASTSIPWDFDGKYRVHQGEKIRFTFDAKVEAGAVNWGGYLKVKVTEANGATSTFLSTSGDVYERIEGLHTRSTAVGSGNATIQIQAYAGSGAGAGTPDDVVHGRNLEVYKAGLNPDQERDVAVHKWHINSLNIAEGPASFDIKEPDQFVEFYNSTRNMANIDIVYPTNTSGSGPGFNWLNRKTNNGPASSSGPGAYNTPRFWDNTFHSYDDEKNIQTTEIRNATSANTYDQLLGGSIKVEHDKIYVAGAWVRVREATGYGHKMSMVASSNASIKGFDGTAYSANTLVYGPTVSQPGEMSVRTGEWRMMSIFFLPSWMTSSEVTTWYETYFGTWSGEYEFGGGFSPEVQTSVTNSPKDARVVQMSSNTDTVVFGLRTETPQNGNVWNEIVYPFLTEIDPMNINTGGDLHFWDFTEV